MLLMLGASTAKALTFDEAIAVFDEVNTQFGEIIEESMRQSGVEAKFYCDYDYDANELFMSFHFGERMWKYFDPSEIYATKDLVISLWAEDYRKDPEFVEYLTVLKEYGVKFRISMYCTKKGKTKDATCTITPDEIIQAARKRF